MFRKKYFIICPFVAIIWFIYWQVKSVYSGDAGDLVGAAVSCGVPHPPGYPLYTLLGCFLTKLPLFTPAFRVGLISSVSAGVTIFFLMILLRKIFQSLLLSLIGGLVLGSSYLFWLYAEVPEVFSLSLLFLISISLSAWIFYLNPSRRKLYLWAFIFGLSLTHHQTILFLVPGLLYLLWQHKAWFKKQTGKTLFFASMLFLFPLFLYLYLPIAALGKPIINWDDPRNLGNFMRLLTRADYGTFTSANVFGESMIERSVQLMGFFQVIYSDFGILGLILVSIGGVYEYFVRRKLFIFNLLAILFIGPLFLFYASFPLSTTFGVATFERFVLLTYPFIVIWIAEGMLFLSRVSADFTRKFIHRPILPWGFNLALLYLFVFILYPFKLISVNYPKISILRDDLTAENLGRDILNTLPTGSILILGHDIPLFNTQYVYIALGVRKDVKLLHLGKLYKDYYVEDLKYFYQDLVLPKEKAGEDYPQKLMQVNYGRFPIYSNIYFPDIKDGYWVPYGLLLRLYKKNDLPKPADVLKENQKLWKSYHNPLAGALGKYRNLMQSTILEQYAIGRREAGKTLAKLGYLSEAEFYFRDAVSLEPDNFRNHYLLGEDLLLQHKCTPAERELLIASREPDISPEINLYLADLYRSCFHDEKRAKQYDQIYLNAQKHDEIPLDQLK